MKVFEAMWYRALSVARFINVKGLFVRVCMVRYFQNNCEDANSLLVEIYFPTSRINEVWLRANDILMGHPRYPMWRF